MSIRNDNYLYRFGQNLARIRQENGLTQSDMELYGISRAYYGRVELGVHSLTLDKIEIIARAFGVPIHYLFLDKFGHPI